MEKKSILVVDDEQTVLEALIRALGSKGYEVATSESGEKALAMLREKEFDMIITDLKMPGLSGIDVVRAAKKKYPSINSFIITGFGDLEDAMEALKLGVDEFIQKPFGKGELLRRIEHCLEKRSLAIKVQRYELMLSASTDMVALFNRDQMLLEANEAFLKAFRVKRPLEGALSMEAVFGGVLNEAPLLTLQDGLRDGRKVHTQEWFQFEREVRRLLDVTMIPFSPPMGREQLLLLSMRDISDFFLANQDLGKSENRYHLALDATMDAVWDYDVKSGKIHLGENWFRLLGYQKDELSESLEKWKELLHPDDRQKVLTALHDHLAGKTKNYREEFRMSTRRGQWRWVLMRGRVVERDGDGSAVRFIGAHKNIDARKYSEELLYASEAKYRSLFNSPNIGIFRLGLPDFDLQEANVAARRMFGLREKQTGEGEKYLFANIIENARKKELLQAIMASREIRYFQVEMKGNDNSTFWAEINLKTKTQKRYLEGTITDITAQKKAEALLLSVQHELEKMVAMRTSELQEALQRMAQEIVERQQMEETLRKSEAALLQEKKHQEEINTALNVLLRKREQDKREIGENILVNVKELVEPIIDRLRNSFLDDRQEALLDLLRKNLEELTEPFAQHASVKLFKLTPTELQVANMVRHGKTTKEIAELMNISPETVSNHRKNIRKKSGLTRSKRNLRSALTLLRDASD